MIMINDIVNRATDVVSLLSVVIKLTLSQEKRQNMFRWRKERLKNNVFNSPLCIVVE